MLDIYTNYQGLGKAFFRNRRMQKVSALLGQGVSGRAICGAGFLWKVGNWVWVGAVAFLLWTVPFKKADGEQNIPSPTWSLQVPVLALPLEALVPAPETLLPEKGGAEDAGWELVPGEIASVGQSRDASRPPSQGPIPVQVVPGLKTDGQVAQNQWQLAFQILFGLPSAEQAGEKLPVGKSPSATEGTRRAISYRLQRSKQPFSSPFRFQERSSVSMGLWEDKTPVLVYNHGPITQETIPPKDHRRTRACYVHPLYGLRGEVLTDDFPKDHYHHHGIFWAWPHIVIEATEHDLWAGSTIRQEFVCWLARQTGPVCAVLGVENGWYVGTKKVMRERIWFWVYRSVEGRHRSVDIALYLEPTDQPVTLWGAPEKSYGGLTVRFAPSSRPETEITVPTGRTSDDLLDTRLKWADFTSTMLGSSFRSGAAILIHPNHPDYPPTWLTRHYGAMCVGWPGVRPKTLHPGQPVRLQYRLWIHREPVSVEELRAAYEAFCMGIENVRWNQEK